MTTDPFALIAERVAPGARLVRRWSLTGGVSAHVDALALALRDGSQRTVVVRRHGAAKWKEADEEVTAREHALLSALHGAGLPVPAPSLLDISRELLPSPYLVQEYVEGSTGVEADALAVALPQMASFLARLHALDVATLPSLPTREEPTESVRPYLPDSELGERIRQALDARGPLAPVTQPSLLHGDFWPGNVLFHDGRLAAVIDWEDAALGDPACDLAGARVELLWRYGEEAMETFTAAYLQAASIDTTSLCVWELYVAASGAAFMSEWGLDPAVEAEMRRRTDALLARVARELTVSTT